MAETTPNPGPDRPATGERTAPFRSGDAASDEPPRPIRVALVPGAGPPSDDEIRRVLRNRLWVIALLLAAFYGAQVVRAVAVHFHWLAGPATEGAAFVLYGLVLATAIGVVVVLWTGRDLSLGSLRTIELVVFLQLAASAAWITQAELRSEWARRYATTADLGAALVTRAHVFNWFALIVLYGTLIPNTWRRCAAVAGALAVTPLAVAVVVGLAGDLPRTHFLPGYLADHAVWGAVAVAVAVYGSYRIEVLRRQAEQARKLGQYVLKRRLGAGGMGEVYLAEHALLRRPCAVKVIRPERAGDPKLLARFEREVRATATLTHPNTVQVYDYGHADDGTFYYVMEYLPGPTLDELVRAHGPLPPARAIRFLRQLCGALAEAHARGLVHRDVKPSNVLVCEIGGAHDVAKLLDFGLVAPAGHGADEKLTLEGAILGTPSYMSPEQAGGSDDVDGRSDLYGLGALAYYLLTGRPPFTGRSVVKLLAAHLYEPPWPLTDHRPDVPADLAAVVLRCLAKDPAARYPDAPSLDAALAACQAANAWTERDAAAWWRGLTTGHSAELDRA